jgi:hypothetical protein
MLGLKNVLRAAASQDPRSAPDPGQRPVSGPPTRPTTACLQNAAPSAPPFYRPAPSAPAAAPQTLDSRVPLNDFWYLARKGKADLEACTGVSWIQFCGPFVATIGGTATGVVAGLCVASNYGLLGGAAIGFPVAALACAGALVLGVGLAQATRKLLMLYTLQQEPTASLKMESLREMHAAFAALPQPQAWELETEQALEQSMAAFSLTKAALQQDCKWAVGSSLASIGVCVLAVVLVAAFSGAAKKEQASGGNRVGSNSGPFYYFGPLWQDRDYRSNVGRYGTVGQTPLAPAVVAPPLHLISRVRMQPHWVTALC